MQVDFAVDDANKGELHIRAPKVIAGSVAAVQQ
jgi:hypothetical protein